MKVLVACEFSGRVRDAFLRHGHDAVSCDLLPSETSGPHHQGDVRDLLDESWDVLVAHPPCTYLARSGAQWWPSRLTEQAAALDFIRLLLDAPVPRIALENPVGAISTRIRKADQVIQPWQFGHGETKTTCLWLVGLPRLVPTRIVDGRAGTMWRMPPSADRGKNRSRTFPGIAEAMAVQWGVDREPVTLGPQQPNDALTSLISHASSMNVLDNLRVRFPSIWRPEHDDLVRARKAAWL